MGFELEETYYEYHWNRLDDLQKKLPYQFTKIQKLKDKIALQSMEAMQEREEEEYNDLSIYNLK